MTTENKVLRVVPRSMMRSFTARELQKQGGICLVCQNPIDLTIKGEGVQDHNHVTGEIRGILHRSCNAALGKVDNAAGRWGAKSMEYPDIIKWLEGMLAYYKRPGTGMMYAMHKTPEEKQEDRNRKAREARAAAKAKLALRGRR